MTTRQVAGGDCGYLEPEREHGANGVVSDPAHSAFEWFLGDTLSTSILMMSGGTKVC